jgi:hypothetical protein
MQVHSVIQPSATVIRITEVQPGSIYKRLTKATYSGDKDRVVFGIVTDVLNNGEESAITALEFTPPVYSGAVEPEAKVFSGTSEVALFPASLDEWQAAIGEAITKQERVVEETGRKLQQQSAVLAQMVKAAHSPRTLAITSEVTPEVEA